MTTTTPQRATDLIAQRGSVELIADYLTLDGTHTVEAATVRGWIMGALEARGDDGLLAVALGACPVCWAPFAACDCEQ